MRRYINKNNQARQSNNRLVKKNNQKPLVPPLGLKIVFWAVSSELFSRYWNHHQIEVNYITVL